MLSSISDPGTLITQILHINWPTDWTIASCMPSKEIAKNFIKISEVERATGPLVMGVISLEEDAQ